MKQASSPTPVSRLAALFFSVGLVAIPVDGIRGVSAFGELGNELSFPFFATAIGLALADDLRSGGRRIRSSGSLRIGLCFLAILVLAFAANAAEILTGVARERAALPKFATASLVLFYGVGLAWLAEQQPIDEIRKRVAHFVCWSVILAIAYALFEVAGRSFLRGPFELIDAVVHSRQSEVINSWDGRVNQKVLYDWDQRIRSLSFEPPAFGNYTGFAWPWVWLAARTAPASRKVGTWTLLVLFTLTIVLSESRTGLLMLLVNIAGLAALALLFAQPRARGEWAAALRLAIPLAGTAAVTFAIINGLRDAQAIVDEVVRGDSVSNLSRLAFQAAGLNVFMAHPLLGVGLGQFGFYVPDALPSWAYLSPEVVPMVTFPNAPWPNVYNLYVRLAAELGIVGLVTWSALWPSLFWALSRRARLIAADEAAVRYATYPIAMNCLGVLTSGFTTDTFRTPMMWVALGLAWAILRNKD